MWVSKKKDERREEFIFAALELFGEKGYEKTSLNDILKRIGITKGSFYHTFKSKEDLLLQIVEILTNDIVEIVKTISEKEMSALSMLRSLAADMIEYRQQNEIIYKALKSIQKDTKNTLIAKLMTERIFAKTQGYIIEILKKGVAEGSLIIVDEVEVSELYIALLMRYKQKIITMLEQSEGSNLDELDSQMNRLEEIYSGLIANMLGIDKANIDFLKVRRIK